MCWDWAHRPCRWAVGNGAERGEIGRWGRRSERSGKMEKERTDDYLGNFWRMGVDFGGENWPERATERRCDGAGRLRDKERNVKPIKIKSRSSRLVAAAAAAADVDWLQSWSVQACRDMGEARREKTDRLRDSSRQGGQKSPTRRQKRATWMHCNHSKPSLSFSLAVFLSPQG